MSMSPESIKQRMVELMLRLAPEEGDTAAQLDGVTFMRSNRSLPVTPALYEPSIVIVIQGRKSGLHDGNLYVYDAQHYLVLALPLPFSIETEASAEEPMLGVALRVGYESPSQFSREFKRLFGRTPGDETRHFTTLLRLAPGVAGVARSAS